MATLLLGAEAARAVSSEHAIGQLNLQRTSNGLPGGVRSLGRLVAGCRKHDAYMKRNNILTHYEQQGNPGYSAAGSKAGRSSVLAFGFPAWRSPGSNPWETAPIHLVQLLAPSLEVSGYAESGGYTCAQTLASPRRPEPSKLSIYTYPGPGAHIYPAERTDELPYTPAELLGIGRGTLTGPNILVMVDGPDRYSLLSAQILHASLEDAGGNGVPLRWVDGTHPKLRGYIPPGGFLIPIRPLKRNSTYDAAVTLAIGDEHISHRWSFRTNSP